MRVVLDGQPLLVPLAGVGHYTRQLVQALARVDGRHRYQVLVPHPVRLGKRRAVRLSAFTQPDAEIVVPGWWMTLSGRIQRRLGRDADLSRAIGPGCDVFHGTNNVFPYRVRARRHVLTIHDLTLLLYPEWHPTERLERMVPALEPAVARADHVITPSQATRNDVIKLLPIDAERVSVTPLGVSPIFAPRTAEEVDDRLAPLGLRRDGYLLFMGTIEPRKNLLRVLEALELTAAEIGPLVVAGERGWNNATILEALARLERTGRVRDLGYVPDELRPMLLGGARALVYPSLYEGFGLPPLEALACGTPVVTSNVSSIPEVVGDAALFVDPEDVPRLAEALTRIWNDDGLRADLRARGLVQVRPFSWERTARLTLDVYRAVLDGAARGVEE